MARKQIKAEAPSTASSADEQKERQPAQNLQETTDKQGNQRDNQEAKPQENIFNCEFDELNRTLNFYLVGGKEIIMREPTTRIFLLASSFISQRPEYSADTFFLIAIANLSILSYGADVRPSFDQMLDEIELADLERLAAALGRFPDAMGKLAKWCAAQNRKLPTNLPK